MSVAPHPEGNEVDAVGQRTRSELAREIYQAHVDGLQSVRDRDLISEKLLLHIDGSGDFQWADIYMGIRVEIPRMISEFRKTENLLRPIIDNAVAHHTTNPLRFHAQSHPDRQARDRAKMDTIWINHLCREQDFNGLFSEAMYMAMPCGFCPVHRYWRDGGSHEWQDPVGPVAEDELLRMLTPGRGTIDCFVGNPFDTVFDPSATRSSIRWISYGRVLPAQAVRDHPGFAHVPGIQTLEGSTRIPSAAAFQRIARSWQRGGLEIHGSPVVDLRRGGVRGEDELITVIAREIPPHLDPRWPEGRLQIIAIPGEVDTRRGKGTAGHAVLLADQPLPGKDYSFTNFYSHHRGSDVRGKPWAEDLDQLQVDLNIAKSKRWEFLNKLIEAPIVAPGGAIGDDMADLGGYGLLEVEPSLAGWRPRVMEWSQSVLPALDKEIEDLRRALYTIGGYQASSRGEAPGSRMAFRAIVALQEADKSVHGPVNMRFQRAASDFARGCWRQMKSYGDIPWLVDIAGDEYSYLVDPYISKAQLSEQPPAYRLVNAFGSSPEMRAQEVIELMGLRGADGEPFITTEEARRAYPNHLAFSDTTDPRAVQQRRARTIATRIHHDAEDMRELHGIAGTDLNDPEVQQAAQEVFQKAEARYPRMRDDDLESHLAALSEITQDETADPIARLACQMRQELYYEWQEMMATGGGAPQGTQPMGGAPQALSSGGTTPSAASPSAGGGMDRRSVSMEAQGAGGSGARMTLSDLESQGAAL